MSAESNGMTLIDSAVQLAFYGMLSVDTIEELLEKMSEDAMTDIVPNQLAMRDVEGKGFYVRYENHLALDENGQVITRDAANFGCYMDLRPEVRADTAKESYQAGVIPLEDLERLLGVLWEHHYMVALEYSVLTGTDGKFVVTHATCVWPISEADFDAAHEADFDMPRELEVRMANETHQALVESGRTAEADEYAMHQEFAGIDIRKE